MSRRGREVCAAVVAMAAVACGPPGSETGPLPLQESALVVDDDVREDATLVAEYAVTEEELREIEEACGDAEAVPLEAGDACLRIMELQLRDCSTPFDFCLRVYDAENRAASYAGWAEVVEGDDGSLCEDGPGSTCLRVGLSPDALRVVEPRPTDTTTSPSPSETSPTTGTPSPSPTDTPSPSDESSDESTAP